MKTDTHTHIPANSQTHTKQAGQTKFECPPHLPQALTDSLRFEYSMGGIVIIRRPYVEQERIYPFDHISMTKSGKFEYSTEDARVTAGTGTVKFLPAGTVHTTKTMKANFAEVAWMRFRFTVLGKVNLLSFFEIPRHIPVQDTCPAIRQIVLDLIELSGKNPPRDTPWRLTARKQTTAFSLLTALLSVAREKPAMHHFLMHTQRLEKVFMHINTNFAQHLTIGDMAKMACLSVSRFSQVFKAATGMPPLQYLNNTRLNRAMELLVATDLPIAAICEKTGWPDQFNFCRMFKKNCGISPSHYRKSQENIIF